MANIAIPALLEDIESDEELDDIPADEKEADPLRHARIKRLIDETAFIGEVEDIECGRVSRERLYRVKYPDGDLEHMTEQQLRQVLLEEKPREVAMPSAPAGEGGQTQEPEAKQHPEKKRPAKKTVGQAGAQGPLPNGGQGQEAKKSNAKNSAPKGGPGQGQGGAKGKVKNTAVLKKPSGR